MQEIQEMRVRSWAWKIPWSRKWQPTPVFLLGKFRRQRSHQESDTTEGLSSHACTRVHTHTHPHKMYYTYSSPFHASHTFSLLLSKYLRLDLLRRRQRHPTPVLLPGKSHGRRSLVGCSPWGREESDMTERLHFHFSLSCTGEGNGNPLQCSCLENPRDGKPGGLQSMGSHRVGHD